MGNILTYQVLARNEEENRSHIIRTGLLEPEAVAFGRELLQTRKAIEHFRSRLYGDVCTRFNVQFNWKFPYDGSLPAAACRYIDEMVDNIGAPCFMRDLYDIRNRLERVTYFMQFDPLP